MKQRLINIFVYGDRTHVQAIGWRVYEMAGTYDEVTAFMQSRVQDDHRNASRKNLDEPISWRDFRASDRVNPIAGAFAEEGIVGEDDVYCVTNIVDGEMRVDDTLDAAGDGAVPDYLQIYWTEDGFDFSQLINDDYFEAIHLLWNNRKYVSCLKLVFSTIDTFGFVEYGPDSGGNCFTKWLDDYCDLRKVAATADELWELRNSLIHMTNLDSRKMHAGKTQRLLPQFTHPNRDVAPFVNGMKALHVARFVFAVLLPGIEKWLRSYTQERGKFAEFIERYDTIVSEGRLQSQVSRSFGWHEHRTACKWPSTNKLRPAGSRHRARRVVAGRRRPSTGRCRAVGRCAGRRPTRT